MFRPRFAQPLAISTGVAALLLAVLSVAGSPGGEAPQPKPKPKKPASFEESAAPILARRCLSCHNRAERKGKFSLQTEEDLNDSGYVEPGDPDGSLLLEALTSQGGKPAKMPKDSDPLSDQDVAAIRGWIAAGAKWPDGFALSLPKVTDRNWWSLKPLENPPIPKLGAEDQRRVRTPIDAFLFAQLRERGLEPNPEADRRVLIRRLYFDLIGLPPKPAEVDAFLADPDPRAYEKLVDRLLTSPHYGERWARHWLDVVHYGDTHGYDKDKPRPNAWPYRDYVIRAFNRDKPYGRFVQEQIAGDVLWPDTVDGVVATGFIAAGPWDFIGHAEVPETKLDGRVARNLDRDNMVTNSMNTFCSLTVQCARCHHHKLDPVTMEDYYSLQAVFAAIDRADRDYDNDPKTARRRVDLARELEQLDKQLADLRGEMDRRKTPEIRSLEARIAKIREARNAQAVKKGLPRSFAYGYHSQVAASANAFKWVHVDLGRVVPIDHVLLFGADEYGWADFGFPHRFRVETATDRAFSENVKMLADHTAADFPRPGARAVKIDGGGAKGRYVRILATKLWSRRHKGAPLSKDWIFALGELAVISGDEVLTAAAVESRDSIEAMPRWGRANLTDGVFGRFGLDALTGGAEHSPTNGYHSQFAKSADTTKHLLIDLGKSLPIDRIRLTPAFPTDWQDTPGFGFPVRFRLEASDDPDFKTTTMIDDRTKVDYPNPLGRDVVYRPKDLRARYVRLTATRLWDRGEKHFALALAEISVDSEGKNVARQAKTTAGDSIESGRWSQRFLTDGFTSRAPATPKATALLALAGDAPSTELDNLVEEHRRLLSKVIGAAPRQRERQLTEKRAANVKAMSALPTPRRVYAGVVHKGSGAFRGRHGLGPREIRVLHRGDLRKPGEMARPGTVPFIPGRSARFDLPKGHSEGQRRVQLARWITDRENPLTWRSIVNRIWLYHFGRGLVDTPNDFGRGGERPTHPRLLDWLAIQFRDGQSIKQLHRLIVNSAAYRRSSAGSEKQARIDSGNQSYWRMNRRRLAAEEIRDSVLQIAGKLNLERGGPGFKDFIVEYPQHSPHYEYHKHDPNDPLAHRRAIYRFIVRSQPQPFMDTLDCADPSMSVPKRDETLTALQALALLNNRFMIAMSKLFADRLQREHKTIEAQLNAAYRLTLNRSPSESERAALAGYADKHGLANTCRLLINLNEFVFID